MECAVLRCVGIAARPHDHVRRNLYLMGLSSRSFSMFMGYSRKGGVDCQSRFVSLVCTSKRSRKGLFPSGEAPPPV